MIVATRMFGTSFHTSISDMTSAFGYRISFWLTFRFQHTALQTVVRCVFLFKWRWLYRLHYRLDDNSFWRTTYNHHFRHTDYDSSFWHTTYNHHFLDTDYDNDFWHTLHSNDFWHTPCSDDFLQTNSKIRISTRISLTSSTRSSSSSWSSISAATSSTPS